MAARYNLRTILRQFTTSNPGWGMALYPRLLLSSHADLFGLDMGWSLAQTVPRKYPELEKNFGFFPLKQQPFTLISADTTGIGAWSSVMVKALRY